MDSRITDPHLVPVLSSRADRDAIDVRIEGGKTRNIRRQWGGFAHPCSSTPCCAGIQGGRCPGDRPPSCQATQPRERELIFNVFRSAKGGFERFHRRLQRIAAGPVIRSAAAQGGKEERASARARAGPHPRGAAWQVGRRQRRCKTQWESGCKWRGGVEESDPVGTAEEVVAVRCCFPFD